MVPRGEGFPAILYNFEVVGPVARTVGDVVTAMSIIGGSAWREPGANLDRPLRILHAATFEDAPVDPVIAQAVADTAAWFKQAGHHVEYAARFDLAKPIGAIWPVISATGLAWLLSQHQGAEQKISLALTDMARAGAGYSAADYLASLDAIATLKREFDALFAHIDILLTPTTAAMPWPANETHPTEIAGRPVGPRGHAVFTPFANALGLPAISLPCKARSNGTPIGFQLCTAEGQDALLLTLAQEYERVCADVFAWPLR
jgi:aspartyl-tRNA(Asn)/glutamyl-tRNA(Gln) amidotransferase subunit A